VALRRPLRWAAALLLIGSLAAASPATAARHKGARFKVVSLVGRQTATWQQVSHYSQACQGEIHESGTQTISFQSTAKPKLKVKRIGSGRFKSAYGTTEVPTGWTFDRTFDRTSTPNTCPTESYAMTADAFDCGKQGPFPVPMNVSYRGTLELTGLLNGVNGNGPSYKTCGYEGYHETDILDGEGKLSKRKVFNRKRRTLHVHISEQRNEAIADGTGSQTTTLTADVTLRRSR
jgi:hypothetical protein